MKRYIPINFCLGLLGAALCSAPNAAAAHETAVEVSVEAAFLPNHGYDDNDHVVMVISGELPHICYTLGETKIEKRGHTIRVHQYAWLRRTGICGTGDADPGLTSSYETEVSLGQLDAGDYEIQFLKDQEEKTVGSRNFNVAPAGSADIDDYAYASTSDIISPRVLTDSEHVAITLQGSVNLSCEHVQQPIRVVRQKDVFVILPIVDRDRSKPCVGRKSEFRRDVNLGLLRPGRYLVHVRSMSGKALNRIIQVIRQP